MYGTTGLLAALAVATGIACCTGDASSAKTEEISPQGNLGNALLSWCAVPVALLASWLGLRWLLPDLFKSSKHQKRKFGLGIGFEWLYNVEDFQVPDIFTSGENQTGHGTKFLTDHGLKLGPKPKDAHGDPCCYHGFCPRCTSEYLGQLPKVVQSIRPDEAMNIFIWYKMVQKTNFHEVLKKHAVFVDDIYNAGKRHFYNSTPDSVRLWWESYEVPDLFRKPDMFRILKDYGLRLENQPPVEQHHGACGYVFICPECMELNGVKEQLPTVAAKIPPGESNAILIHYKMEQRVRKAYPCVWIDPLVEAVDDLCKQLLLEHRDSD